MENSGSATNIYIYFSNCPFLISLIVSIWKTHIRQRTTCIRVLFKGIQRRTKIAFPHYMIFATSKIVSKKGKNILLCLIYLDIQKGNYIATDNWQFFVFIALPFQINVRVWIKERKIEKMSFWFKSFRPWCYWDLMQSKIKDIAFLCRDFSGFIIWNKKKLIYYMHFIQTIFHYFTFFVLLCYMIILFW